MEKTIDFAELQELKEQFNLINDKLENQEIINDYLMKESIQNKMSYFDKLYRFRLITSIIAMPIVYLLSKLDPRIPIEFVLFIGEFAIVNLIFDVKCYEILSPKNIIQIDMVTAVENILRFRKLRNMLKKIVWGITTIMLVWLVAIFSDYKWEWEYMVMGLMWISTLVYTELKYNRKVNTTLDETLDIIDKLKSEK